MSIILSIKELLKIGATELTKLTETPQLESRVLLGFCLSMSHEQIIMNYDRQVSAQELKKFHSLIDRRKKYEPIAYIIGRQEFYGRDFIVDNNVLIPRPETEMLVDVLLSEHSVNSTILELGCGSGALCISLALEMQNNCSITAVDLCKKALQIAKNNASRYDTLTSINFLQSNWYSALPANSKFDYIISNPPYISYSEKDKMAKETLLHEPEKALYAEKNGLADYIKIIEGSRNFLRSGGKLILEIGCNQGSDVKNILKTNEYSDIEIKQDLSGHDRLIILQI